MPASNGGLTSVEAGDTGNADPAAKKPTVSFADTPQTTFVPKAPTNKQPPVQRDSGTNGTNPQLPASSEQLARKTTRASRPEEPPTPTTRIADKQAQNTDPARHKPRKSRSPLPTERSTKPKQGSTRTTPADTAENAGPEPGTETHNQPGTAQSTTSAKRRRGRPSLAETNHAAEAENGAEGPESTAASGESSTHQNRRPASKVVDRAEPETERQSKPGPERTSSSRQRRRGKPPAMRASRAQSAPAPDEQPGTEDADAPRRRPRSPRGETVPVTVHRLVNTSILGGTMSREGSGDEEEEESADELSSRQKQKLPSRGGVNPADVLSQICRETLEKTLTTLKNGIANENNPTRRTEWTRKRKAVEAFGSELEGRLLDLSAMLDSNFGLGVQLKKAKREMMDLRSRLYHVRRERESVALQMDAVRAKHMEEENAKSVSFFCVVSSESLLTNTLCQQARTTINNSLHSLELALDRTQQRSATSTNPSPADIEFMLRAVAEDVSCRGTGAQGGLLDQIRAFNAQLEATARNLEG